MAATGTPKYGDLSKRLWFLLGALVVYRIGAHIPVPGIDPVVLANLFKSQKNGILGMFNMFSGGALPRTDGVLIVTSRMRRILAIDTATTQVVIASGSP